VEIIVRALRKIWVWLWDQFSLFGINPGKKGGALIIRVDAIGDYVLWRNSGEYLITACRSKGMKVVLLANSLWSDVAKIDLAPDDIWVLDRGRFYADLLYRQELLRRVRQHGFQLVIQPTYSRELLYGDALVRASGAPSRIGLRSDLSNISPWQIPFTWGTYTRLVHTSSVPLTELERNAEFTRALLGVADRGLPRIDPSLFSSKLDRGMPSRYIVVCAGSSWIGKQWPAKRFADIARRVHDRFGHIIVFVGTESEAKLSRHIADECNVPSIVLCGETTLADAIRVIARADLLLSNDTGAAHIAVAVKTPSVCVLGGGHFGRFMPYPKASGSPRVLSNAVYEKMDCYNCNWICRHPRDAATPVLCIDRVSVEKVWAAVSTILGDASTQSV
jgi:ADP-heptose:LPS heptosyltransferase